MQTGAYDPIRISEFGTNPPVETRIADDPFRSECDANSSVNDLRV